MPEKKPMTDLFTPDVRYLVVATKSASRYFDLDAVREPTADMNPRRLTERKAASPGFGGERPPGRGGKNHKTAGDLIENNPAGAPPLDWWKVTDTYVPKEWDGMSQATWYVGDALEVLRTLPDASGDLCMTSPAFLALRSYLPADHPDKHKEMGSEATPGAFLDVLLDVTEELARVLAPHGSLVVELGDTYSGSGGAGGDYLAGGMRDGQPQADGSARRANKFGTDPQTNQKLYTVEKAGNGWPLAKSLCMIPSSYAWALAYGRNPWTGRTTPPWRVRNLVAWCRPNPPVGALGDKYRPGTSYLTVACKSGSRYFDLDAVREIGNEPPKVRRYSDNNSGAQNPRTGWTGPGSGADNPAGAPPLDWWEIPTHGYPGAHYATFPPDLCVKPIKSMCPQKVCRVCGKPSERITEHSFALDEARPQARRAMQIAAAAGLTDEHLAAVRAVGITGSTVKGAAIYKGYGSNRAEVQALADEARTALGGYFAEYVKANPITTGWSDCGCAPWCPTCGSGNQFKCGAGVNTCGDAWHAEGQWRRGVVLDPFAGSGTTLAVATGMGLDAIGIDLDPRNLELARQRIGLFLSEAEVA